MLALDLREGIVEFIGDGFVGGQLQEAQHLAVAETGTAGIVADIKPPLDALDAGDAGAKCNLRLPGAA